MTVWSLDEDLYIRGSTANGNISHTRVIDLVTHIGQEHLRSCFSKFSQAYLGSERFLQQARVTCSTIRPNAFQHFPI